MKFKDLTIYLSSKKIIAIAIFISGLILNYNKICNNIYYFFYSPYKSPIRYSDWHSLEFGSLVNSVLGIPYSTKPLYRNDSHEITKYSKEQWFALPYYKRAAEPDMVDDLVGGYENLLPSHEEVQHALSLVFTSGRPSIYSSTLYNKFCSNLLTCELLTIVAQDTILQLPGMLDNLIKIAERPCDFIKTKDEVNPKEIWFTYSERIIGSVFHTVRFAPEGIENFIKLTRKKLTCDYKDFIERLKALDLVALFPRRYVLIIFNEKGNLFKDQKNIEILIERQDIKKL